MASDAAERDARQDVAAARRAGVRPGASSMAWPGRYRSKGSGRASDDMQPAEPPAGLGRGRDVSRLGLAALRVGPVLMLLVVVLAASALSPVFLTTRNLGNVLARRAVIAMLAMASCW